MKKTSVSQLVLMAFYVAMFMVLDVVCNAIPFLQMPNGGSLGVSAIPLLMASYQLGWKKGVLVCVVAVFCMFVTGPMYTPDLAGFLLDYLIAFAVYGLACLFPNFGYFYSGVLITNFLRFLSSTISGVYVWGVDWIGSIVYQAWYMVPTTILTLIVVPLLYKALEPRMKSMVK
jgi:thiamine transporter